MDRGREKLIYQPIKYGDKTGKLKIRKIQKQHRREKNRI